MSNNPSIYEVLSKQYLRLILDISERCPSKQRVSCLLVQRKLRQEQNLDGEGETWRGRECGGIALPFEKESD